MPVVLHKHAPSELVKIGVIYQTLVDDSNGSTPVCVGIQTSAPGCKTTVHSHPYMEIITVLEGHGEAWMDGADKLVVLGFGVTLAVPANIKHWCRATGDGPLITYGVGASPHRVVKIHEV